MGFAHNKSVFIVLVLAWLPLQAFALDDPLNPTYPIEPPDYTELDVSSMIQDARVSFGYETVVDNTNGYKVTSPDGDTFYVDDIEQPTCAFYGTYVSAGEGDFGSGGGLEVFSNVYVEEVNFENCK